MLNETGECFDLLEFMVKIMHKLCIQVMAVFDICDTGVTFKNSRYRL